MTVITRGRLYPDVSYVNIEEPVLRYGITDCSSDLLIDQFDSDLAGHNY